MKHALLIASGDSRLAANELCWPTQARLEADLGGVFHGLGCELARAHPVEGHGFIDSQHAGRRVFEHIDPDVPIVVAEAVWQYSHHVLIGLARHRGPILIAANFSGQWPGLVGALNLRASLTKAGVEYAMVWSDAFPEDEDAKAKIREWIETGTVTHDLSHVRPASEHEIDEELQGIGTRLADAMRRRPAILGVLDEGCMGMFNAIIPDHLLHAASAFKERLSQSELVHRMGLVTDAEARAVQGWLVDKGMRFDLGSDPTTDLVEAHVLEQCRMYIAAARLADMHDLDAIGIQYQLGLTNVCAASDLAEGLLNCTDRPPVHDERGDEIRPGRPIAHFNEVDECAGLDAVLIEQVWNELGMPTDNTLHDLRWADRDESGTTDEIVWVLEISGAVPPSHLDGGYAGAVSERQPPMYFAHGGGSIKGVSKPGVVVWSRIYVADDALHMDIGLLDAIRLPEAESHRRWSSTTSAWPIMHAVFRGVTRDQMMARHKSNHIQVVYATDEHAARRAIDIKAMLAMRLGIRVWRCGI